MIGTLNVRHITDDEVTRDLDAVLEKVRRGTEIVIERDHRPSRR
jgi:hypothetical protein